MAQGKQHIEAVFRKLFPNSSASDQVSDVMTLTKVYHKYKREYVKHLAFTPGGENLCKYLLSRVKVIFCSVTMLDHAPLETVYIHYDTATYDEIERDQKVTTVFQSIVLIWALLQGEYGSSTGFDRRHNGSSHRLLHSQWS